MAIIINTLPTSDAGLSSGSSQLFEHLHQQRSKFLVRLKQSATEHINLSQLQLSHFTLHVTVSYAGNAHLESFECTFFTRTEIYSEVTQLQVIKHFNTVLVTNVY